MPIDLLLVVPFPDRRRSFILVRLGLETTLPGYCVEIQDTKTSIEGIGALPPFAFIATANDDHLTPNLNALVRVPCLCSVWRYVEPSESRNGQNPYIVQNGAVGKSTSPSTVQEAFVRVSLGTRSLANNNRHPRGDHHEPPDRNTHISYVPFGPLTPTAQESNLGSGALPTVSCSNHSSCSGSQ